MRRRADGGPASAADPGNGTGRREPGRVRVRSLAARGLAAGLLAAFAALLALPLQGHAQTSVPHDWSLKPSDLDTGDRFRLLFASSTKRDARSLEIGPYNTFVQTRAAAGHTDIQAYSAGFKVVGCTQSVDATVNTGTTGTGVPIYWLDGDRVADDYADFYDGSWDSSSPTTETGASVTTTPTDGVITGCSVPGTAGGFELGVGNSASMGNPSGNGSGLSGAITPLDYTHRLYGLSVVFEVSASTDATLSALVVNDGTNDRTLVPTFVPGTFDYDTDVGNAVTTVTLTATVNNSNASVTVTLDGTAIADTDFSDGITVPSLADDDNEIVVTVTPESGAAKTYTITVTRARRVTTTPTPPGEVEVPNDWILIPSGLVTGDKFRLLFLSLTRIDGSSYDIADYNTFVQGRAAIRPLPHYSDGYRAVGCTADSDATANTGTAYNSAVRGVPIYWLGGNKVADDYADFYDGDWDDEANPTSATGSSFGFDTSMPSDFPLTGCQDYGEEATLGGRSLALGQPTPRVGRLNSDATGAGPIHSLSFVGPSDLRHMYGLSQVFRVGASTDATLSDLELEDASDNSAITLSPGFSSSTTSYTASEANDVDEITVLPTVNDSNATYEIRDGDGTALVDADSATGFQVALSEGENTVKVEVTRAAMTIPPPSGTALVSNLMQTSGGIGSLNSYDQAQAFTTGDNFGGYALTSVEIQTTSSPNLNHLTVSIRSADSSGSPDASLGTLMNLAAVASDDGIATFTASGAGIDLERETTYFVMVDVSASNPSGNIQNTASDAEDPGKAANWSIGDTSLYRNKGSNGSWTSFADSKKIRVKGAAKAGVGSTDADLTGLALKDAADGSTIDLNETFAAATKSYTADVGNAVAAVTVEPARSDSNATVAYLDASDTVLTDADTNTTGFQTALLVGATTIKVKVTAEDDLTTETYTVVVTRAAATATTLVTIAADAPTAIYNEGVASFTVTRTGATTDPLDVVVALTQTRLFLDAGGLLHTVTIAAGSSSKTLSFPAGDLLLPASETRESGTLTATVLAGTGYNPGTPATASVDVVVALTVSFDELSYRVDEGVGTLVVMLVGRTGVGAPAPASAWFSVSSAELNPPEAVSSEDYGSLSVSVQIPASAYVADGNVFRAEVPVDIEILDDARDEPDERLHLELQRSPGLPFRYSNFTDSDGVGCRNPICGMPITIFDNDAAPTVTLVLSPDSITENGGLSQITATLDHPSSEQTSIDISATAVPPAVADDFYRPPSRRLSIPIGETKSVSTGHVVVLAIDNNVYSGNKFVTISGTAMNFMGIFQPQAQTLTIEDDESDPTATDATLNRLALKIAADDSTIALSPDFAPGTTSYTAIVGVGVDTITVEPTENDSNATVAYLDGSDTALTDTDVYKARFQAALAEGANTIKVKVTAADRSTIQTYTVTVTRATAATDADLTGLALKNAADDSAVTLTPGFATATTSYTADVANTVLSITVEPAKSDSNAAVAYLNNGGVVYVDADTNKAGFQVELSEGANTIHVQVTAGDGTTTKTYTVVVEREAAGVTVSETALTVTEADTTGDSYTVVLDSQPTANVVVTVAGHAGTDVLPAPTTLTFTTVNWETAQTVTVTAVNDADTTNDTVSLTHSAASTDTDYDGITIAGVPVTVEDNDTAQVTGLMLTPGDGELAVAWAPVPNATGYEVQWKSGGQGYNTSGRQATIGSGSTASHTISSLTNGTTYTVRVRATRTDANAGPYSDEAMDAPEAAGVTVSETALTVTEQDSNGDSYTVVLNTQPTANVVVTVAGHAGTDVLPAPTTLTFTTVNWETAQTVTVTAVNDADTTNDTVSLTHSAASTDTDYDVITIAGVTVTTEDNDTAKVTGVMLTPGDGELGVAWTPVPNATGYEVQWKSGGQGYNTSGRQATIGAGQQRGQLHGGARPPTRTSW